jgi:hypothetical protein
MNLVVKKLTLNLMLMFFVQFVLMVAETGAGSKNPRGTGSQISDLRA